MSFDISVSTSGLKRIACDVDKLAEKTLRAIGDISVDAARRNMNVVSYGNRYVIKGKVHIASKKGDSPNNLTGNLYSSIRYKIEGRILEFGAGNEQIDYVKKLENPYQLDRPNIVKVFDQEKVAIQKHVNQFFINSVEFKE